MQGIYLHLTAAFVMFQRDVACRDSRVLHRATEILSASCCAAAAAGIAGAQPRSEHEAAKALCQACVCFQDLDVGRCCLERAMSQCISVIP